MNGCRTPVDCPACGRSGHVHLDLVDGGPKHARLACSICGEKSPVVNVWSAASVQAYLLWRQKEATGLGGG